MRSSLILGEGGKTRKGVGKWARGAKRKKEKGTKRREIRIANAPARVEFGSAASVPFSLANGIFPVECFQVWERVCVCARAPSREVNSRLSWILIATSHFLVSGVKIDGEVLKCDTGRYYPACHSHLSGLLCVCPASTPRA